MAVGARYQDEVLKNLHKFDLERWEIHLETDNVKRFEGIEGIKAYKYPNIIFSYFDKLLFVLKIIEQENCGALWFDADKLWLVDTEFLKHDHQYESFTYLSKNRWAPYFWEEKFQGTWSIIREYFNYLEVDPRQIVNIWEEVWYMPYHWSNSNMRVDLEMLRVIFHYRSVIDEWGRPGMGEGEGIALGFIVDKYSIDFEYFPIPVFPNNDTKVGNVFEDTYFPHDKPERYPKREHKKLV